MNNKGKLSKKQRDCILNLIQELNNHEYVYMTPSLEKELGKSLIGIFTFGEDNNGKFITYNMNWGYLMNL